MNIKMCFVDTAMVAACIAAQGGVVPPDHAVDPTTAPAPHSPSSIEGTIHAEPGDGCGAVAEREVAPTSRAPRSADQWDRWYQQHAMR